MSTSPDAVVIGGGIVGCAAAAFLAAEGLAVELFEHGELAGAASGRNSGSVQDPFDEVLAPLHEETLSIYHSLEGFDLPAEPAGVLLLARDHEAGFGGAALLTGSELIALEPSLAPGLVGTRLETGYPVEPAAATLALAELARARGAVLHEGAAAGLAVEKGSIEGVVAEGERRPAGAVLVAAGPWTPSVIDPTGRWCPIEAVWGVVAEVALDDPPRHVLEQAGVEAAAVGELDSLFSLVATPGACAVGSTFMSGEPDAAAVAPGLLRAGADFVPALADAKLTGARACARPVSWDGRPLIGPVPGVEGLHLVAGHGPWGISAGPASARLAVDALLGRATIPAPLAADRFGSPLASSAG